MNHSSSQVLKVSPLSMFLFWLMSTTLTTRSQLLPSLSYSLQIWLLLHTSQFSSWLIFLHYFSLPTLFKVCVWLSNPHSLTKSLESRSAHIIPSLKPFNDSKHKVETPIQACSNSCQLVQTFFTISLFLPFTVALGKDSMSSSGSGCSILLCHHMSCST